MGYFRATHRIEKNGPAPAGTTVMIHGLFMGSFMMSRIAAYFRERGWCVVLYDYPTMRKKICAHGSDLAEFIGLPLFDNIPRIDFVTHSMGGILLRAALAQMTEAECRNIDAVVMLGPPNRGSILAALGANALVRRVNASLGDMTTDENSFVNTLPPPVFVPPVGIVAGRFDGKVALDNTSLPDGQPFERLVVDCTHPGLRDPRHTLEPIRRFLLRKTFA